MVIKILNLLSGLLGVVILYSFLKFLKLKKQGAVWTWHWVRRWLLMPCLVALVIGLCSMALQIQRDAACEPYRIMAWRLGEALHPYLPPGGEVIVFTSYPCDSFSRTAQKYYIRNLKRSFSNRHISIAEVICLPDPDSMSPELYHSRLQDCYDKKLAEHSDIAAWICLGEPPPASVLETFYHQSMCKVKVIPGLNREMSWVTKNGYLHSAAAGIVGFHLEKNKDRVKIDKILAHLVITPDNISWAKQFPEHIPVEQIEGLGI